MLEYFNLAEQPFGVTPDPRYLYFSATHREALASLMYGIQSGRGFLGLVAHPGMGKTTLLFQLLRQMGDSVTSVFLFQPLYSPEDLLRSLLHDLDSGTQDQDFVRMNQRLNELLVEEYRQGRRVVVVIDEAQNLPDSVLELVRMFSNFETSEDKLVQIILAGQPQLADRLASPTMVQLRQRMSIVARLKPFAVDQTREYVGHRLQLAGYDFRIPLFTADAGALIAEYSGGIPRNINNICFNCLSLGCALQKRTIDAEIVEEVLRDLDLGFVHNEINARETEPVEVAAAIPVSAPVPIAAPVLLPAEETGTLRKWVPKFAIAVVLFAFLVAARGSLRVKASQISQRAHTNDAAANGEVGTSPVVPDSPGVTADEIYQATRALRLSEGPQLLPITAVTGRLHQPITSNAQKMKDPTELWELVRKQDSDAAVALARMYMDGRAVSQNCVQANLLLQAASKKGNKAATDLLSASPNRCD